MAVYSPYVILNKTGLDINIRSKSLLQQAKNAAGQSVQTRSGEGDRKTKPYMFSYGNEDRQNRAILKVSDSEWSRPQSLDAMGTTYEVSLPSSKRHSEINVGISIEEGEGKVSSELNSASANFILKFVPSTN